MNSRRNLKNSSMSLNLFSFCSSSHRQGSRPAHPLISARKRGRVLRMTTLIADGLCIRPLRRHDIDAFHAAALESASTVGRWLPWCRADYSLDEAGEWLQACERNLEEGSAYSMGIFSEDGELFIGGIGINGINREHNFANVGYWVRQSQQGQGIAPRALGMIARYGFRVLGLTRLEIVVQEDNRGSRRVAEKAGASFDGLQKNRLVVRGTPHTAAMYSLTPA
jgi:RimJ/RimL family protein N-acetyltransferase